MTKVCPRSKKFEFQSRLVSVRRTKTQLHTLHLSVSPHKSLSCPVPAEWKYWHSSTAIFSLGGGGTRGNQSPMKRMTRMEESWGEQDETSIAAKLCRYFCNQNAAFFGDLGEITRHLENYKPAECRWSSHWCRRHGGVLASSSIRHDSPRKRLASRHICARRGPVYGSWLKKRRC